MYFFHYYYYLVIRKDTLNPLNHFEKKTKKISSNEKIVRK